MEKNENSKAVISQRISPLGITRILASESHMKRPSPIKAFEFLNKAELMQTSAFSHILSFVPLKYK